MSYPRVPREPESLIELLGQAENQVMEISRMLNRMLGMASNIRSSIMMYRLTLQTLYRVGVVGGREVEVRIPREIAEKIVAIVDKIGEAYTILSEINVALSDVNERARLLSESVKYRFLG